MKKRCCIIGAAPIFNYKKIAEYISPDDFIIYCDGGLSHRDGLGMQPDLVIGDFDSHEKEDFGVETIVLPRVKDDTDTFFAAKEGLNRGFSQFLLIGMVGKRLDHTLGNISLLLMLHNRGAKALMVDDYSEMEIVSTEEALVPDSFPYFSLINVDGPASGVRIEDALFPTDSHSFISEYPQGISNEPLPGKTSKIRVLEGKLLLLRIFDR